MAGAGSCKKVGCNFVFAVVAPAVTAIFWGAITSVPDVTEPPIVRLAETNTLSRNPPSLLDPLTGPVSRGLASAPARRYR